MLKQKIYFTGITENTDCTSLTPLETKDPLAIYSSMGFPHPASLLYGSWFAATAAVLSANSSSNILGLQGN